MSPNVVTKNVRLLCTSSLFFAGDRRGWRGARNRSGRLRTPKMRALRTIRFASLHCVLSLRPAR